MSQAVYMHMWTQRAASCQLGGRVACTALWAEVQTRNMPACLALVSRMRRVGDQGVSKWGFPISAHVPQRQPKTFPMKPQLSPSPFYVAGSTVTEPPQVGQGFYPPSLLELQYFVPQGLVQLIKVRGDVNWLLHNSLLDGVETELSLLP